MVPLASPDLCAMTTTVQMQPGCEDLDQRLFCMKDPPPHPAATLPFPEELDCHCSPEGLRRLVLLIPALTRPQFF